MKQEVVNNCNYADFATTALGAVQSIASISQFTLAALGVLLGLVSLIGIYIIYKGCIAAVTKLADKKLDDYMTTEKFKSALSEQVAKGIDDRLRKTVFVNVQPEQRPTTETPDGFPDTPKG